VSPACQPNRSWPSAGAGHSGDSKQQSLEEQTLSGMGLDDITGGDEGKGLGPSTQRFQPMCALTMAGNCLAFQEAIGTAGGGCVALTGQGLCHPRAWIEPLFTWREQLFATAAASSVPSQESFCPFVLASVCKAWRLHVLALISIDEEKRRTTLEIERETRMELLVHVTVFTGECTSRARTLTHCFLFVMCSPLNIVGCAAKGTFEVSCGARCGKCRVPQGHDQTPTQLTFFLVLLKLSSCGRHNLFHEKVEGITDGACVGCGS